MKEDKPFHETLDELIELFKKIKDHSDKNKLGNIDLSFMKDFDFVVSNYEMLKRSVSPDMLEDMGEPMKGMIKGLIEQLRDELQEIYKQGVPADMVDTSAEKELEEINLKLRDRNLSMSEIDALLDRRSQLLSKH